ncbi:MAG: phage major capsid protein [Devosiaceae bacterium]|nr:phage major capsid protein [Devosiaceae bacterium MH13]
MTNLSNTPETKARTAKGASQQGEADIVASMMEALSAYRDTNDARLDALEQRGAVDPLVEEKLSRIDTALDDASDRLDQLSRNAQTLATKAQRPSLEGAGQLVAKSAYASAFERYVRAGSLAGLSTKAMESGTDADGGYLVPKESESTIGDHLAVLSPMRSIATIRQVSSTVFRKPVTTDGFDAGWVAENAARPETGSVTLSEIAFPTMELYAMPAATATLLDDAAIDIDMWLAGEVDAAFAEQESLAFVSGNGSSQPLGFLTVPTTDEASWSWGNLGTVSTGVDADFPSTDPSEVLIDLVYALKSTYRQNGTFVMNRSTQATLRKMRDADGNYIWSPPAGAGAPAALLGFPVVEMEHMPAIGSDAKAIAFGDFRRGYLVVDRIGTRLLRDPYTAKPYVLFYVTKRVGGGVQDFDAIKLLTFSAA